MIGWVNESIDLVEAVQKIPSDLAHLVWIFSVFQLSQVKVIVWFWIIDETYVY